MNVELINNVPVKIWAEDLEENCMEQIANLAHLPFVFKHVAVMPDAHAGKGMPIGGVLATNGVVIPNAVGVDIGCGMCAVKTNILASEVSQELLRKSILRNIRRRIPLGMEHHKTAQDESLMPQGFDIDSMHVCGPQYTSARKQIGTLGGGNHFIEIQKDQDGYMWVMIHSGSRNLGKMVGDYYNKEARKWNDMFYTSVPADYNLAFLPMYVREFKEYWNEMQFCIQFAFCNRKLMMDRIMEVIKEAIPAAEFEPMINIAHNYAAWENHFGKNVIVHRKGAVRAGLGDIGIIPGSQGTHSYIVEGLGEPESFMSSSHGAGRRLSRTAAINTLSLEEEIAKLETQGIVHAIRNKRDLQEAAGAYKDIDRVLELENDLVKIRTTLSPMAVIKGD